MARRKTIYIAGPITGVANYRDIFCSAERQLAGMGYDVLNPASLPEGHTKQEYMRVCFSFIDMADMVYFLPGYENSPGALLEQAYCDYIGKDYAMRIDTLKLLRRI